MKDLSHVVNRYWGDLVGRRITGVRQMFADEIEAFGWYDGGGAIPVIFALDDGSVVVPNSDPEGNGPGHLLWITAEELAEEQS